MHTFKSSIKKKAVKKELLMKGQHIIEENRIQHIRVFIRKNSISLYYWLLPKYIELTMYVTGEFLQ